MKRPRGIHNHEYAPEEFRRVPDMTGSVELDRVIQKNPNKDMKRRFEYYLDRSQSAYGPKTGYSGYHGYSGDD